jgi:hypothetical protein
MYQVHHNGTPSLWVYFSVYGLSSFKDLYGNIGNENYLLSDNQKQEIPQTIYNVTKYLKNYFKGWLYQNEGIKCDCHVCDCGVFVYKTEIKDYVFMSTLTKSYK